MYGMIVDYSRNVSMATVQECKNACASKQNVHFVDEGTYNAIVVSDSEERYFDEMGVGLSTSLFTTCKSKEPVTTSTTASTGGQYEGIPLMSLW